MRYALQVVRESMVTINIEIVADNLEGAESLAKDKSLNVPCNEWDLLDHEFSMSDLNVYRIDKE